MSDTLTVTEAAKAANVSVRTVRRWIANGQVVTRGHGHGRRVVAASLSKETANSDTSGQPDVSDVPPLSARTDTETAKAANSDTGGHEADRLADLVRELSSRLADQTALTAIWQERARVLIDQLALAAPQESVTLPASAPTETSASIGRNVTLWRSMRLWRVLAAVLALAGLLALLAWPR